MSVRTAENRNSPNVLKALAGSGRLAKKWRRADRKATKDALNIEPLAA